MNKTEQLSRECAEKIRNWAESLTTISDADALEGVAAIIAPYIASEQSSVWDEAIQIVVNLNNTPIAIWRSKVIKALEAARDRTATNAVNRRL